MSQWAPGQNQWTPPQGPLAAGPPGHRRRTPLIAGVVAGLVLLLVIATVAVVLATRDRYAVAGRSVWSLSDADDTDHARGAWMTADSVVFGDERGGRLTALAKHDGSVRWRFRLPAPGGRSGSGRICTASTDLVDGMLAVVHQSASSAAGLDCVGLLLLDLRTGEPRWTVNAGDGLRTVEAAAGMVLVLVSGNGRVIAFDPATGARRWSQDTDRCAVRQIVGNQRRIGLAVNCGGDVDEGQAWTLDPATGATLSRVTVSRPSAKDDHGYVPTLVSVEPMVLVHRSGSHRASVLTPDGKQVAKEFPLHEPKYSLVLYGRDSMAVTGSRLVMPTTLHGLVAWDLRTGAQLWDRGGFAVDEVDPRGSNFPHLVTVGDAEIVMLLKLTGGARLLRVDPTTGDATALSPIMTVEHVPFGNGHWLSWDGNRLYTVNRRGSTLAFAVE